MNAMQGHLQSAKLLVAGLGRTVTMCSYNRHQEIYSTAQSHFAFMT
jgi:hypothetical protein